MTADPLQNYCLYHVLDLQHQGWCYREPIRTDCVSSMTVHSHQFTCSTLNFRVVMPDPLENYCLYYIFSRSNEGSCYRWPVQTHCVNSMRFQTKRGGGGWRGGGRYGSVGKNMKIRLRPTWIIFIFYWPFLFFTDHNYFLLTLFVYLHISAHVLPDVRAGEKTNPREIPQLVRDPDETLWR